eukprot:TRINITY_DN46058_c0_g1_i1.p1 TRINITY_DN46058_c0_g1~~TRINITY_DN46058_c0_g1_i1.p1  ORF type:complete len:213 (-),score=33.46 TRINITY_DN46058_c0_g1_i1:59-697(-)
MALLEQERDPPLDIVVLDTAGQIEIFTWSASGNICTDLLAGSGPTVVVYVVDTPRCMNPQTFMSNMLQACSILYKTRLPIVLAFNKIDVVRHEFALEWMKGFDKFSDSLDLDGSYAASLARSLSLVLDEFYSNLRTAGVSSITGEGMDALLEAIDEGSLEYTKYYLPDLEARKAALKQQEEERMAEDLERLKVDVESGTHGEREVLTPGKEV